MNDLDSKENITLFVSSFYDKLLSDEVLAPIFNDVAQIDIKQHLPRICSYWEKLLLGDKTYQRHTMNIHRLVDEQRRFTEDDFDRWLMHFTATAKNEFAGEKTDRALQVASTIVKNMQLALDK